VSPLEFKRGRLLRRFAGVKRVVVFTCRCGQAYSIDVEELAGHGRIMGVTQPSNPLPGFDQQVLSLAASGLTDKEIARRLQTSVDRVKRGVRDSLIRLSARNRTEAVVRAALAGIIFLDL
jgi:DNA-binding NarL/FixJ family response regulator